jgi:hypothetical protein
MNSSEVSPDPAAVRGTDTVVHHGTRWSKGVVLRWPNLDVIFGYKGGARSGTYVRGLQPVGSSRVGHAMARLKL